MNTNLLQSIFASRLWAFILKEFTQVFRNKLLLYLLVIPPTVQLLILGGALDPALHHLNLGVCDLSATTESRQLQDELSKGEVFDVKQRGTDTDAMAKSLERGKISAILVIPKDFANKLVNKETAPVQTLVDGADAYTANVAGADLHQAFANFNLSTLPVKTPLLRNETKTLYNPGLKASWYIVPGILGSVLTLVGTLVSSAVLLREKEHGTLEQVLMTPASAWEVIFAKILPLFLLLMADVLAALWLSNLFFGLPFPANPLVFFIGTSLYICSCIGCGMLLGTVCRSQRQAQLLSFFINIPLIQMSGSVVPYESMPEFMQKMATLDPLRYFALFARASLLKGDGFDILWPYLLILGFCACLLLSISTLRFRRQLA